MAKLSAFRVDSKAINQGAWIKPGEEYDDLEILTRGFTDAYTDARAAKVRRVALHYGNDANKIPAAEQRAITVDCLISHVLLDVRGLSDDAGNPVPFGQFCDLLRDPDFSDLFVACIKAATMVGTQRRQDAADAVGNSAPPSA